MLPRSRAKGVEPSSEGEEADCGATRYAPDFVGLEGLPLSSTPLCRVGIYGVGSSLAVVVEKPKEGNDLKGGEGDLDVEPLRVIKNDGDVVPSVKMLDRNPLSKSFESDIFYEEGNALVEVGGDEEVSWLAREFTNFCVCLGMPTKGFEEDVLSLFRRMKERKEQNREKPGQNKQRSKGSLFNHEMKRLEWFVKDSVSRKNKGVHLGRS